MTRRRRLAGLACAALIFGLAVAAQHGADRARPADRGGDLLYLPNEKLLNHFTGGMSSIIADFLWVECVQYVATEAKGERSFTWLNQMVNTVVKLDPYFVDAYRFGGMFLAALKADDDAGIDLIDRGIVANPDAWVLPYEGAMIYLLNRRDDPGSKIAAARYLGMAAAHEAAPPLMRELAEKLQGQFNLDDVERDMWTNLLDSSDKLLREVAERKLRELAIRETCGTLNERAGQYRQATGKEPSSLADLGLKSEDDGLGGRFFIDPGGTVRNTTLLDEETESLENRLQKSLDQYQEKTGAYPAALDVLVREGYLDFLPGHPYPGGRWAYDPVEGTVSSVMPKPPSQRGP